MPTKRIADALADQEARKSAPRRYRNITRVDHAPKRTHGYSVRIMYAGKRVAKFFSDKQFGGKREALKEAIAFRNEAERELGRPRTDRLVIGQPKRSSTGVVGVRRVVKRQRTKAGNISIQPVYEATWSPIPNVLQRTSFAINTYGEEEAFRRAVEFRRQKEQELFAPPKPRRGRPPKNKLAVPDRSKPS